MKFMLVAHLAVACLLLQSVSSQVDAAAADAIKNVAKQFVEKAADKAGETTDAPQTGGVRQTVLHTATDFIMEHGSAALEKQFPAVKALTPIAKKLAKPLVNKAHEKINNLMNKEQAEKEDDKDGDTIESPKEADKDEQSKTIEADKGDKKQNEYVTPAPSSENDGEKKGLMSKLTSMVKGDDKAEEATPAPEAKKDAEQPKEESSKTAGAEKNEKDDKKQDEHVTPAPSSENGGEKKGLMSKLTSMVKGDDKKDDAKKEESVTPAPEQEKADKTKAKDKSE